MPVEERILPAPEPANPELWGQADPNRPVVVQQPVQQVATQTVGVPVQRDIARSNNNYNPTGTYQYGQQTGIMPPINHAQPFTNLTHMVSPYTGQVFNLTGYPSKYPHMIFGDLFDTTAPYMNAVLPWLLTMSQNIMQQGAAGGGRAGGGTGGGTSKSKDVVADGSQKVVDGIQVAPSALEQAWKLRTPMLDTSGLAKSMELDDEALKVLEDVGYTQPEEVTSLANRTLGEVKGRPYIGDKQPYEVKIQDTLTPQAEQANQLIPPGTYVPPLTGTMPTTDIARPDGVSVFGPTSTTAPTPTTLSAAVQTAAPSVGTNYDVSTVLEPLGLGTLGSLVAWGGKKLWDWLGAPPAIRQVPVAPNVGGGSGYGFQGSGAANAARAATAPNVGGSAGYGFQGAGGGYVPPTVSPQDTRAVTKVPTAVRPSQPTGKEWAEQSRQIARANATPAAPSQDWVNQSRQIAQARNWVNQSRQFAARTANTLRGAASAAQRAAVHPALLYGAAGLGLGAELLDYLAPQTAAAATRQSPAQVYASAAAAPNAVVRNDGGVLVDTGIERYWLYPNGQISWN